MSSAQSDWRYRLKGDPASWLLDDSDNPSIFFWFLRDIVGRPEESPALIRAQEQILYSHPVQAIFALQDPMGFWESPNSLDLPRYSATLWMLALLAELGISRTSRRASLACGFVLQNHVNSDGAFIGLRDTSSTGLLARTLVYFKRGDSRLVPILDRLEPSASQGNVYALWALAESRREKYRGSVGEGKEKLAEEIARGGFTVFGAFPPFESKDLILALRILKAVGGTGDQRILTALERIWENQKDGARWSLEMDFNGLLPLVLDSARMPGKWATLNVLRAVGGLYHPSPVVS